MIVKKMLEQLKPSIINFTAAKKNKLELWSSIN